MKNSIVILAILTTAFFTNCKNNTEKEADAIEEVQNATENLDSITNQVKEEAITKANDAEWQTYKTQANKSIANNKARIVELQLAMNKPGKNFDASYKKSISDLEAKNTALATKISDYENNQTDWDTFKREFDSDMEGMGKALKDLTVNNKK